MLARSKLLIVLVALSAMALSAPAAGAAQRVLGVADGVSATRAGNKLMVRFTAPALAAAKLKAGGEIAADCSAQPAAPGLAFGDEAGVQQGAYGHGKVRADGAATVTLYGELDQPLGTLDGCEIDRVDREKGKDYGVTTPVARVGLTPAGDVWADESARAAELRDLILRAHGGQGYKPVGELGAGVVALDGPDATPAAGVVGYWTDGVHATVAAVSSTGRRLVDQDLGNGMLRTNVLDQTDPLIIDESSLASGSETTRQGPDPEDDPGASPYKADDPVTPADGVRASVHGQRLAVRFTGTSAKAFRAIAGRKVMVICFTRPAPALYPVLTFNGYGKPALTRVPRHGGSVAFTMSGAIGDGCIVADDGTIVAFAAPTAVGKRWWQDLSAIFALFDADPDQLAPHGAGSYYSTADVLAHNKKSHFVALAGPGGSPPVGRVGVWTDGARHAVIAMRSGSGRRLVMEDEGDGMVKTNVFGELGSVWLLLALGDAGPV
jgi:hypothetical protein